MFDNTDFALANLITMEIFVVISCRAFPFLRGWQKEHQWHILLLAVTLTRW